MTGLPIAALGAGLWPAAAAALESIGAPGNWTAASGLVAADFAPLARMVGAVLREAPEIEQIGRCAVLSRGRPHPRDPGPDGGSR